MKIPIFVQQSAYLIAAVILLTLTGCGGDNTPDKSTEVGISEVTESEVNQSFEVGKPTTLNKKVFMHYLSWFGEGEEGRHWRDGVVNEPLIGYYNSQSWATHIYHILLSASVGIDGAMVNVRTEYDQTSFDLFVSSLERIEAIYPDFSYDVSISYDDQDTTISTATTDFTYLNEQVIPNTTHYLYKNEKPVVFIWEYDGFLTSQDYRNVANDVFLDHSPILIKTEIDESTESGEFVMNSFYPWVQGWALDGSDWGEEYINWFYRTLVDFKESNKIEFGIGAVWPGFDDRNASWGQSRWIDRNNGNVYLALWALITDTYKNNIDWVILETWNDFNEGSELEPIVGDDNYQYILLTAKQIEKFKGVTSLIDKEQWMFKAATNIYRAAKLIEQGERDYDTYYPVLQQSIEHYLKTNGLISYNLANDIILND